MKKVRFLMMVIAWAFVMCVPTQGIAQNKKLLKEAENGSGEAQALLATYYFNGTEGFEKDIEQAKFWAREAEKSARDGSWIAQAWLTARLFYGDQMYKRNVSLAKKWADATQNNPKLQGAERAAFMDYKKQIDAEFVKENSGSASSKPFRSMPQVGTNELPVPFTTEQLLDKIRTHVNSNELFEKYNIERLSAYGNSNVTTYAFHCELINFAQDGSFTLDGKKIKDNNREYAQTCLMAYYGIKRVAEQGNKEAQDFLNNPTQYFRRMDDNGRIYSLLKQSGEVDDFLAKFDADYVAEITKAEEEKKLRTPKGLAEKIVPMIGKNSQPFSEVISLCDKLMALEKSDEQKKAIKRVINECHTMATGYDSETGYSRAYDHRGTERGKQELALAAKLQEYLIEGGDMDELVDYAYRCRQNRDTATAKKYFQQAADKGNAMAMRGLAFCYEDEKNLEKAEEWYKKLLQTDASEQYCVDAMNFYRKANRSDKILEILELSAEKSKNRDAMLRLGDIYRNGKDWDFKKSGIKVTKNLATAIKWYKKAREIGSKAALFFMADCYWTGGTGVKQNRAEASKLYQKLMDEVGIFNLNISEAEADEKSKANYRMGYCYENGIGAVRNIPKAWNLYCDSHEADAYYRRGVMMEKRWVYERLRPDIRRQQVRQFYQTAANMGHKQAQQALNRMYR